MLQNGGQKRWVYFALYKTLQGPKADTFLFTFDSCCKETVPIDWAISHLTCSSRKQCEFSNCQIRKAIVLEVEAQHWLMEDSFLNIFSLNEIFPHFQDKGETYIPLQT